MNHNKLLKMQEDLDNEMYRVHNLKGRNVLPEKNLALIVEFAEFINALSAFKYWKKNKNIDWDHVYEEFADILHFIYSLYLATYAYEINEDYINENIMYEGLLPVVYSMTWIRKAVDLTFGVNASGLEYNASDIDELYIGALSLANHFGLEDKKIEEAFVQKNNINYERIKNNY